MNSGDDDEKEGDRDVEPKRRNDVDGEGNQWGQQWVEQKRSRAIVSDAMPTRRKKRCHEKKRRKRRSRGQKNLQLNSMGG